MFFSKKDETLAFTKDNHFFLFGKEKIAFEDVESLYERGVANYTNSVYEKKDLYLTLVLKDKRRVELKADTKDMEAFILLNTLHSELSSYRTKQDIKLFQTLNDELKLVFENDKFRVLFSKSKRPNSTDFVVEQVSEISNYFLLEGEGFDERIVASTLSDSSLFTLLSGARLALPYSPYTQKELTFLKYFKIIFFIFALNGIGELWFKTSFFSNTEPIETLSLMAGMALSLGIITAPMYWLVDKLNVKKIRREEAQLRGKDVSGREFNIDFSNLLLFLLVGGLALFIYKSYF